MALIENLELMNLLLDAKANMEVANQKGGQPRFVRILQRMMQSNAMVGGKDWQIVSFCCYLIRTVVRRASFWSLCFANANCPLKHSSEQGS